MTEMRTAPLFELDGITAGAAENEQDHSTAIAIRLAAEAWIRLNPRLWAWLEEQVLDAAHNGRMTSVRELCERIRWADNVDEEGNPVHISNSLTACFARMLVEKHPETAKHIIMRKSVLDEA